MQTALIVAVVLLLGAFVQSATGFGMVLVAMPILAPLLGLRVATPLMAGLTLVVGALLIVRYRHALQFGAVWRLVAASLLGIPVGLYLLARLPETTTLPLLGAILIGYVLYRLLQWRLPALANPRWAFLFGFLGGMLSGAYNASGPAVVLYGNMRRWPTAEFKSNLQTYFLVNSIITTAAHSLSGNVTPVVLRYAALALPFVLLGLALGVKTDRLLHPARFQQLVLGLLLVLGLRLIVG